MTKMDLYAIAVSMVGQAQPTMLYETISERKLIPVSQDRSKLEKYVDNIGIRTLMKETRMDVNSDLSHTTILNIYPLVHAGIISEDRLHILP